MKFPARYWEPGEITATGKQLWYSRDLTKADWAKRHQYEDEYEQRQLERNK